MVGQRPVELPKEHGPRIDEAKAEGTKISTGIGVVDGRALEWSKDHGMNS